MERIFVPASTWSPDQAEYGNSPFLLSLGDLVPTAGGYSPTGLWRMRATDSSTSRPAGMHVHSAAGGFKVYVGDTASIFEFSNTTAASWAKADKSRLVGGAYAASPTGSGWQGASFGDAVIMTNFTDDVQLLTPSSAANFVKLAQSGGGNPGMDPKAKFVFPIKNNLFLANLNLAAGFDSLPIGNNPTVVAWSQSDVPRQFGSANLTPQLIGSGYQPLNYDLGDITGGVGGEYGIIALQRGIVRVDGPPYTFRPISMGVGCSHPNSLVRVDEDVYFWGPSGPMVLRGGEGPAIAIGQSFVRYLFESDNPYANLLDSATLGREISAASDFLNRQVWFSYPTSVDGFGVVNGHSIITYDIETGKFGAGPSGESDHTAGVAAVPLFYLRSVPPPSSPAAWVAGRDIVALRCRSNNSITWAPSTPDATTASGGDSQLAYIRSSYFRPNNEFTTRVVRTRPVFSLDSGSTPPVTGEEYYRNRPAITAGALSSPAGSDGWCVFASSPFAVFHSIASRFQTSTLANVRHIVGWDVDIEIGPVYSD